MGASIPKEIINLLFGKMFAENCMKMREIGPRGLGFGFLAPPQYPQIYVNEPSMIVSGSTNYDVMFLMLRHHYVIEEHYRHIRKTKSRYFCVKF